MTKELTFNPQDKGNCAGQPSVFVFPVIDLFTSIQGEGKYAGQPSIFMRVSGCNLRCVFGNSICDTPYSSFHPEQTKYTYQDIVDEIRKNPNVHHIVITGGEPTIYQKGLVELLNNLESEFEDDENIDWWQYTITVETNGSVTITEEELVNRVDLWSFSPKLSTAVAKPGQQVETPDGPTTFTEEGVAKFHKIRKNNVNLANMIISGNDVQLKFVYSGEESYKEIKEWAAEIQELINGVLEEEDQGYQVDVNNYIMLMPEGMTESILSLHRKEAAEICVREGWAYTDRLHITIWGDKRGF